jgi:putative hydrolase of the HAD superfamily
VANAHKPSPAIFSFALEMTGSSHQQSIMIGDNWTADIQGAIQSNIFAVHFDPTQKSKVTNEYAVINSLHHLPSLLDS